MWPFHILLINYIYTCDYFISYCYCSFCFIFIFIMYFIIIQFIFILTLIYIAYWFFILSIFFQSLLLHYTGGRFFCFSLLLFYSIIFLFFFFFILIVAEMWRRITVHRYTLAQRRQIVFHRHWQSDRSRRRNGQSVLINRLSTFWRKSYEREGKNEIKGEKCTTEDSDLPFFFFFLFIYLTRREIL